MNKHPLS